MTDGEHKHKQFMARMNYSTYMRLRMSFKPLSRTESAKDYFLRLAKHLEAINLYVGSVDSWITGNLEAQK